MKKRVLYLVATPIGNYDDITLRALNILKAADIIVCEEFKPARRLLANYKIQKELISLNEHNESESAKEIIAKIKEGKQIALISDAGTPLFSDPGHTLVNLCLNNNIPVVPIPGANSIIPSLVGSGLDFNKFYFVGWLSPKREIRKRELLGLKKVRELLVVMETPYRLQSLLSDVVKYFGEKQYVVLAYKLTMPEEKFYRGTAIEVLKIVVEDKLKGEFVLLIKNN